MINHSSSCAICPGDIFSGLSGVLVWRCSCEFNFGSGHISRNIGIGERRIPAARRSGSCLEHCLWLDRFAEEPVFAASWMDSAMRLSPESWFVLLFVPKMSPAHLEQVESWLLQDLSGFAELLTIQSAANPRRLCLGV